MEEDKKIHKKKIWIILLGAFLLFIGVYFSISAFFYSHYYWRTVIAGKDCSCMTVQDAEAMLYQDVQDYRLEIHAREGITETISAQGLSMDYSVGDELSAIRDKQNPFFWFLGIFRPSKYSLTESAEFNKQEVTEAVKALSVFSEKNIRVPKNAYISEYIPEQKGYEIIEEDLGSSFLPQTQELIVEAFLQKRELLDLEEEGLYQVPQVSAKNGRLNRLVDRMNQYTHARITYQFGQEKVILDGDTIHEWISVRGGYVHLDKDAVKEYVIKLAKGHDSYYNKKEFVTSSGEIKYLNSGYGWLIDIEAETEALIRDLKTGKTIIREPVYSRRGEDFSENNIAGTYVEVDLGDQHLYLYVNGNLILETDIVSGCMIDQNATPEGIFDLEYKTKSVVLKGPTWESYVNYWMPFYGSVGMHDATWRNHFGGDIYIHSGSHGCINLPYQAAEELYGYVYAGMPVVCYY